MPGFGFGFGWPSGRQRGEASPPAELLPSTDWNGTAASGFDGNFGETPSDPVRTTAKPVCRLLQPPNQFFTDGLTVGVLAAANNGGSLLDNLGLEKVTVHFEGATHDIAAPSFRTFTRYDGSTHRVLGWWITLKKREAIAGHAHVYFEAVPRDSTMQNRVMGPYQFSPADFTHDFTATIASDGTGDYTTIADAIMAAKAVATENPLFTFIRSGTYDITSLGNTQQREGYAFFECVEGVSVTIAKPEYVDDTSALMRTRWDGMWFRGSGITFDMANVNEIFHEAQVSDPFAAGSRSHVFEGVRFTRSLAPGALVRKTVPTGSVAWSVRGSPWWLECDIHNMQDPSTAASLYRGCNFRDGYHDVAFGAACMVGCTVNDWSAQTYRMPVAALSVQYNGGTATATISLTGTSAANNRVVNLKEDGVSVATFGIGNDDSDWIADTNYTVQHVADWINAQPGWSATVQDNTRLAAALTDGSAGYGAFTDLDAKSAALQLYTAFDLHTDFYQKRSTGPSENVVVFGNWGLDVDAQLIMIGGNMSQDWLVANNALGISENSDDNPGGDVLLSQLSQPQSHVVFVHNSFPQQALFLRTGSSSIRGYEADSYCLIANNALGDLSWDIGGANADLTIASNHLHGDATGTGGVDEVIAGDETTLYAAFNTGDFTPAGALAANRVIPVLQFDRGGKRRGAAAPPGAMV